MLKWSLNRTIDIKNKNKRESSDKTNFDNIMIDKNNLQDYFKYIQSTHNEERQLISEVKYLNLNENKIKIYDL